MSNRPMYLAALGQATQETERQLLDLLLQEEDLRERLSETRRRIGLALGAHRRAYPAIPVKELSAVSGVNRTVLWEIEVNRAWRKSSPADVVTLARTISTMREAELVASGEYRAEVGAA